MAKSDSLTELVRLQINRPVKTFNKGMEELENVKKKNTKNMSFKKLWGKKLITPIRRFGTPAALTYFTHSTLYLHIILALPTFRSFFSELFPQFSSDQNFLTFRESNRMKRKFCRKKFRMWSRCRQVVLAFGNFRENEKVKFFYFY